MGGVHDFSLELKNETHEFKIQLVSSTSLVKMTQNNQAGDKICRKFNLTIISAVNLPNVRTVFKNRIQAVITIGGDKKTKKKSPVDKRNGLNPAWNYRVKYTFEESSIINDTTLTVVIKLYSKRCCCGDIYVGEVHTSLKELFEWAGGRSATFAFPIKKGAAAKTNGALNVTYSFGESFEVKKPPGLWKKFLVGGSVILLRLTLLSAAGDGSTG